MYEVHCELFESVQQLSKPAKRKFLHKMDNTLEVLANKPVKDKTATATQTSEGVPTSEGETTFQRVSAPTVTTTNDPTDPRVLLTKSHTHK